MKKSKAISSPQLHKLKGLQREAAYALRSAHNVAKRGLASFDKTVQEICVEKARALMVEATSLTWDGLALQMQLAQELPTWGVATYHFEAQLEQWAKVHALPSGRFIFEAITADAQGVLAELPTFQLLGKWRPSTPEQYNAQLQLLLDDGGITWNAPKAPEVSNP